MKTAKRFLFENDQVRKVEPQVKFAHPSFVIWMMGLSGAGKSTLADMLAKRLHNEGYRTYVLDGDTIRGGLNKDLGFSKEDRHENIRRATEVAKMMVDAGIIVIAAFITPHSEDRKMMRELLTSGKYYDIFMDCPLEVCEQRDVKKLYEKARKGLIKNFTGIGQDFEAPDDASLVIRTDRINKTDALEKIYHHIKPALLASPEN
jgi:adenylylsulfate kinase